MKQNPQESDWKQYREMIPNLSERYLEEKNQALANVLTSQDQTPTERFWATFEQIGKEKKILQDCLDNHSRSKMTMSMMLMLRHGMLKKEDLDVFSNELRNTLTPDYVLD